MKRLVLTGVATVTDLTRTIVAAIASLNRANASTCGNRHPYVECYDHQGHLLGFIDRACWSGLTGQETGIFLYGEVAGTYGIDTIGSVTIC